jgi:hypothetical protein
VLPTYRNDTIPTTITKLGIVLRQVLPQLTHRPDISTPQHIKISGLYGHRPGSDPLSSRSPHPPRAHLLGSEHHEPSCDARPTPKPSHLRGGSKVGQGSDRTTRRHHFTQSATGTPARGHATPLRLRPSLPAKGYVGRWPSMLPSE